MIDNKTIDLATDKHFTQFAETIKKELGFKLANNELAKEYSSEIDKIQNMRDAFAAINKE